MVKRFVPQIPIGVKIFGIATTMLGLLVGAAYLNYRRIAQVNNELIDIAQYLTPITIAIATIDTHALEQEIHFERALRLLQENSTDTQLIETELRRYRERGDLVDREIAEAIELSNDALSHAKQLRDVIEFARVQPLLEVIEAEHQALHDHELKILKFLRSQKPLEAELLIEQLEEYEDTFDGRVEALLIELSQFTARSARYAEEHERQLLRLNWILAAIASTIGILFASAVTAGLVRPVRRLLQGTQAVEQGNLDVQVSVSSRDEIETLADSFNVMLAEVRQKEQIKATFGQYVDPRIVEELLSQTETPEDGEKQIVTVFVSDVTGFSRISELLSPTGLVNLLNQYLTLAAEPISTYNGVINQFIGDAVVAFWGPPFVAEADHAKLACYAALDQLDQLQKLQRQLPDLMGLRKGLPHIAIRIGLATGEVVAGNIGSEQSKSYTVIGEAVQLAERLEEANKRYGTTILIAERTRQLAGDAIETRAIDRLQLTNEGDSIQLYELLGRRGELDEVRLQSRDRFEQGLVAYQKQNWEKAETCFQACLRTQPEDGPSRYYLQQLSSHLNDTH